KEQEENADDEKDPDRLVFGAFPEDEEADRKEEEPDDRLVEVRRIAEGAPGEGDARRELVVAALDEIVEGGADPASEQLPGGIGGLAHDAVIDSFDLVSRADSRPIGPGPADHLPDQDTVLAVRERNDAVG